MTYCVSMCVDNGLVFLSDTRTNAGVDHVSAARKMVVYEHPGERVITPASPLDEVAKYALISMDSTLRSNLSVGLPLDLLVYEKDALRVTCFATLENDSSYYQMIHRTWGERLRQIFGEIPNPSWTDLANVSLCPHEERAAVPRLVIGDLPPGADAPAQTLAEDMNPSGRAIRFGVVHADRHDVGFAMPAKTRYGFGRP
ncbi:hypothetical protein BUMB_05122 [Candidatus Paraburkholderia calva]|nr:hypothetical protein BUMB_05122 [Candidatus Paraburkholderia calva]